MRLFVAVDLPETCRSRLAALQKTLAAEGIEMRWVRPGGIHLTLRFLGEGDAAALERTRRALDEAVAGLAPFEVALGRIGAFPARGAPRVLWVGLEGDLDRLSGLAAAVEGAAVSAGWPAETRPFRAHVTLARAGRGRPDPRLRARIEEIVGRDLPAAPPVERPGAGADGAIPVRHIVLYESSLARSGARYEPRHAVPLAPAAEAFP